jgi:hypothetical protein
MVIKKDTKYSITVSLGLADTFIYSIAKDYNKVI